MSWYDFLKTILGGKKENKSAQTAPPIASKRERPIPQASARHEGNGPNSGAIPTPRPKPNAPFITSEPVRRHFYNERGFQTYGSFFAWWDGWITAGHVITEAADLVPPFCQGDCITWPDGLDAALIGCTLPLIAPDPPRAGQDVIIKGYPAGSRHIEERRGAVYFERSPGTWIAHIKTPDEPVVTGMSGGMVMDAQTEFPIGILITRNSPADLNSDRDPDESADFVALCDVWHALQKPDLVA
jgi:hypothetical protein